MASTEAPKKLGARTWEYDESDEDDYIQEKNPYLQNENENEKKSSEGTNTNINKKKPAPVTKPRQKRVKLTEGMIISAEGIEKIYETFPSKLGLPSNGEETKHLRKMIKAYKEWAYHLFPQLAFEDFINRLEVLGRTNQIHSALTALREKERAR